MFHFAEISHSIIVNYVIIRYKILTKKIERRIETNQSSLSFFLLAAYPREIAKISAGSRQGSSSATRGQRTERREEGHVLPFRGIKWRWHGNTRSAPRYYRAFTPAAIGRPSLPWIMVTRGERGSFVIYRESADSHDTQRRDVRRASRPTVRWKQWKSRSELKQSSNARPYNRNRVMSL